MGLGLVFTFEIIDFSWVRVWDVIIIIIIIIFFFFFFFFCLLVQILPYYFLCQLYF